MVGLPETVQLSNSVTRQFNYVVVKWTRQIIFGSAVDWGKIGSEDWTSRDHTPTDNIRECKVNGLLQFATPWRNATLNDLVGWVMTATLPSTNRARCQVTSMIGLCPTTLPLRHAATVHTYTYSFITSCQTQPYMRAEIAQPTAKTIVTQLQFVLY